MTEHTPGPWHIGMKPGPMVYGPSGEQVVGLQDVAMLTKGERDANARLIAASPDLLVAAQDFIKAFGSGEFDDPLKVVPYVDRFNAAITKATESEDDEPDGAGNEPDLGAVDYRETLHRGYPEAGR